MASAAPKTLELPPSCAKLYGFLRDKDDVPIVDIHEHLFGRVGEAELRTAQQRLGAPITRLNRRLREHRQAVKPGRLKGTYTLVTI